MPITNNLPNANDHRIDLFTAIAMTTNFRDNKELILQTAYQGKNVLPNSETFHRDAIDLLLSQSGCAGLRVYYGMDANDKIHAILVGVNGQNEDILASNELSRNEEDEDIIIEVGQRCPPSCPPESALNP